jgi:2-desacetyl-2-hydroxyethyl bacteriochlorophyllide A dehydrogenase
MKAVVLNQSREIELVDVDDPSPLSGEVVIAPRTCGICGTDLHAPRLTGLFSVPNNIMGHEFCGTIVEKGKDVQDWQIGDRVAVNPNGNVCGSCGPCVSGKFNLCRSAVLGNGIGIHRPGGMAEFVSVSATPHVLHRLPDGVSDSEGAWVEPVATVIRSLKVSGIRSGDTATVLGAGPIGLLTVQALSNCGARKVVVVEPTPLRRELAKLMGADLVLDPLTEDIGSLFGVNLERSTHIFECSGASEALGLAVEIVEFAGTVTLVGIPTERVTVDSFSIINREIEVRGSIIYVDEFGEAIDSLSDGKFEVDSLTTEILPISEFKSAFTALANPTSTVKVLLHP